MIVVEGGSDGKFVEYELVIVHRTMQSLEPFVFLT